MHFDKSQCAVSKPRTKMAFKYFVITFTVCLCIGIGYMLLEPSFFSQYFAGIGITTTYSKLSNFAMRDNIFTQQSQSEIDLSPKFESAEVPDITLLKPQPKPNFERAELSENQSEIDFSPNFEWAEVPDIALLRSAYFDDRPDTPVIRIVALLFSIQICSREHICVFTEESLVVESSRTNCVVINHNDKMTPVFFECKPPESLKHTTMVTIRSRSSQTVMGNVLNATTLRKIQRKNKNGTPSEVFSCISPLFDFKFPDKLILFIEYYKSQGVAHFFVYHQSSSETTKNFLRKQVNDGIITVIPWTEQKRFQFVYHGQILHMNDCVLQGYLRNAKFMLTVDVDEFIWPKMPHTTVKQLLDRKDTANSGSLDFQSAFYHVQQKNDALVFGDMSAIFNRNERSKQAVKPKAIYRQTVHQTWQYFSTFQSNYVSISDAVIYHLRSKHVSVPEQSNLFDDFIGKIVRKHNLNVDGFR